MPKNIAKSHLLRQRDALEREFTDPTISRRQAQAVVVARIFSWATTPSAKDILILAGAPAVGKTRVAATVVGAMQHLGMKAGRTSSPITAGAPELFKDHDLVFVDEFESSAPIVQLGRKTVYMGHPNAFPAWKIDLEITR